MQTIRKNTQRLCSLLCMALSKLHVNSPSVRAYVVHPALTIHLVSLSHFIMTLGRVGESSVLLSAMSRFRASCHLVIAFNEWMLSPWGVTQRGVTCPSFPRQ